MIYITTFYSHFGAIRFKKHCDLLKRPAKLMPVPRDLSSSCGTCVRWEGPAFPDGVEAEQELVSEEIEQTVLMADGGYQVLYKAENS